MPRVCLECSDSSVFVARVMNNCHYEGFQIKEKNNNKRIKKKKKEWEERIGIEAFNINCQLWYDSPAKWERKWSVGVGGGCLSRE